MELKAFKSLLTPLLGHLSLTPLVYSLSAPQPAVPGHLTPRANCGDVLMVKNKLSIVRQRAKS